VTDARPSVALAAHRAAVTALVAAAGGVGAHPVGAATTGEDVEGDGLTLAAWFDAVRDRVVIDALESDLDDLLDVGVRVTPVAPACP
jgi:hypothetical protein